MGNGNKDVYVMLRINTSDARPAGALRTALIVAREAHLQFGGERATTYLCDPAAAAELIHEGEAAAVQYDSQKGVDEQMSDRGM